MRLQAQFIVSIDYFNLKAEKFFIKFSNKPQNDPQRSI